MIVRGRDLILTAGAVCGCQSPLAGARGCTKRRLEFDRFANGTIAGDAQMTGAATSSVAAAAELVI